MESYSLNKTNKMEEYKNEFWKDNGFNTKEEYNQFMQKKIGELFKMIKDDPKLIAVFKRLANK